jgi:hypothetical protein
MVEFPVCKDLRNAEELYGVLMERSTNGWDTDARTGFRLVDGREDERLRVKLVYRLGQASRKGNARLGL